MHVIDDDDFDLATNDEMDKIKTKGELIAFLQNGDKRGHINENRFRTLFIYKKGQKSYTKGEKLYTKCKNQLTRDGLIVKTLNPEKIYELFGKL